MSKTEDIRNLMDRLDENTLVENPLVGLAAGVAGRALATKAIKTGVSKVKNVLDPDDDLEEDSHIIPGSAGTMKGKSLSELQRLAAGDNKRTISPESMHAAKAELAWRNDPENDNLMSEGMSDVAQEIEEWAHRAIKHYNGDTRRVEWAFNKKFPQWKDNKGANNFLKGILHNTDTKPELKGKVWKWKDDVEKWVDKNAESYHGDRDRMMLDFRNAFKHLKNFYSIEKHFNEYLNSKENDMNESNYPDDFRGIPGENFDDDVIYAAQEDAWGDMDEWLRKGEGREWINILMSDADIEEKESVIIDDILPSIHVKFDELVAYYAGYPDFESDISRKAVKAWFDKWSEKHNISIRIEDEAYESMNGMYEDNAKDLVNSGAWNKAEENTKYDPPKTGNKGKSARAGFVG